MATHSSILAWRIPWTEESGRLQSMGSQRVEHDWVTKHSTRSVIFGFWFGIFFPIRYIYLYTTCKSTHTHFGRLNLNLNLLVPLPSFKKRCQVSSRMFFQAHHCLLFIFYQCLSLTDWNIAESYYPVLSSSSTILIWIFSLLKSQFPIQMIRI